MATPPDRDDVAADDEYVERLRNGETPDDEMGQMLGAWRDEARGGDAK